MFNLFKALSFAFFFCSFSFSLYATNITQQQIDQFTNLPPAQQAALARSMGVDLNDIKSQINGASSQANVEVTPTEPREVELAADNELTSKVEQSDGEDSEQLQPFGYDVFANNPQTFAPTTDVAIPLGYIVGPGDVVSIQMFGKENLSAEIPISREGQLVLPNLGPFSVSGLSFVEMKQLLKSKIKEKVIGVNVVVGLSTLRTMRVFVLGDAYKPGPYHLSSLSSISHALFAAGGIRTIGSLRNIQLKRAGKLIKQLDLYELLINGDSSNDIMLQSGDVVFIPSVGKRVSVSGEVRRPAIYELNQSDTFAKVIAMAGGLLPSAYSPSIVVERYQANSSRQVINLDANNAKALNASAQAGDVIKVAASSAMFAQSIELSGAVLRAGNFQWQQGMKISDVIPSIDSHLEENADLSYGLVVREVNIAKEIEVLQFSLVNAISQPDGIDNITLEANDKVVIFGDDQESRDELLAPVIEKLKHQGRSGKPLQLAEITGEVKYPGTYPLAKNNKVSDQITAAGGLSESAYLARADITRDSVDAKQASKQWLTIDLGNALAADAKPSTDNLTLQSKDRINIYKIPKWSENRVVELKGEFVFPGHYTIRRGENLSDLIERAGGFTDFAHLEGSVFTRVKLQELEKKNLVKLSEDLRIEIASKSLSNEGNNQTFDEMQKMLDQINKLEPVGRLVIDLPKALASNSYNIALEDGDVLHVPTLNNSVNVIGQVQVASSHMFDEGLTAEDYLKQSGGSKKRADEERIYIISANGSIKMLESNWYAVTQHSNMQPGDTVVVPLDAEYMSDLSLWTSATTILYNTAVAIAAISGI
ncbi:SLBB domain-containing protein [Thalassotalea sp. PLHSN55]|uniref:SLBB domain-containing protein n=1 Tax=Thalassotalea sp. PLHSN55 TaxID=3435888 RepID=UPI003F82A658